MTWSRTTNEDGSTTWYTSLRRADGTLEFAFARSADGGGYDLRIRDGRLGTRPLATRHHNTLRDVRRAVDRRASR